MSKTEFSKPISIQFAALLVGCFAIALVPSSFQAQQLAGVANFRDIGGYKTTDGHQLKKNVLFRSGELSGTTAKDQEFLKSLNIRYEIDLRTDTERNESPSRWGGNPPKVISVSVGQPRNSDPAAALRNNGTPQNAEQARALMQQATARIALVGAADIGQVLSRLAAGDEPALIHCSAGKDRTGVTVAILMTLLQIPRDQVYREYLKSNDAVEQQVQRQKAREQSGAKSFNMAAFPPEAQRTMMGTDPTYLDAAFGAIDKEYGSFDAYTKNGLKITPEQIRALRAKLLEP